jgi:hypothetical protein
VRAFLDLEHFEPLTAIAEGFHERIGSSSSARCLAEERKLDWYNLDMSKQEKQLAGIWEDQRSRPDMFQDDIACRVPTDNLREDAWATKLLATASGTTLVICGYLHFESLVRKLLAAGHIVDKRVYLETVPVIMPAQGDEPK